MSWRRVTRPFSWRMGVVAASPWGVRKVPCVVGLAVLNSGRAASDTRR